jgi:hypothetical protein
MCAKADANLVTDSWQRARPSNLPEGLKSFTNTCVLINVQIYTDFSGDNPSISRWTNAACIQWSTIQLQKMEHNACYTWMNPEHTVLSEKQTHKHTACDSTDRNVQDRRIQRQEVDSWGPGAGEGTDDCLWDRASFWDYRTVLELDSGGGCTMWIYGTPWKWDFYGMWIVFQQSCYLKST